MQKDIFSQIVKGELPCHKIYEDASTMAFLDIHPVQPGHTLVIPKNPVEFVWDLSADDYESVMKTAKITALRLREVLGVPYVGEQVVGNDVPYAHIHLIPFTTLDEFRNIPDMSSSPDHSALAIIANKLRF